MKRFIPLLLLLATPAYSGGITHKITATAQASVDGSYSHAKRIGSTYSMSSSGVSHGAVGSLPMLGDTITYTGGDNTGLAATITSVSGGTIGLTPGKSGTSVTGSITSALSIGD